MKKGFLHKIQGNDEEEKKKKATRKENIIKLKAKALNKKVKDFKAKYGLADESKSVPLKK